MLSAKLPFFQLFAEDKQRNFDQQQKLNHFLDDLAHQLAQACKQQGLNPKIRKELTHEFYAVCMMNVLFGNPMLLVHQYHPDYRGPRTLEKSKLLFANQKMENLQTAVAEKIRRNALTELLKFLCSNEFTPCAVAQLNPSDDQIYSRAKDLVLNGDIKGAVRFLTENKKTKFALILAQSVNATQNMAQLKAFKQNCLSQGKMNRVAAEIIDIITGCPVKAKWQQTLLCHLLFEKSPALPQPLTDVLRDNCIFETHEQDVNLTSLKVFARIICQDELDGFSFNLTPESNSRNQRLRWLVNLILMNAINLRTDSNEMNDGLQPVNFVEMHHYTDAASKFVRQLLHANDWKSAIAVTMLMPQTHQNQRQRMLFEIMTKHAPIVSSDEARRFVIDQVGIPAQWVSMALALKNQYAGNIEAAVDDWINAQNFNQAHALLFGRVLPLYMTKSSGVSLLKALTQQGLSQEEKKRLILGNEICSRQAKIDKLLILFEAKRGTIEHWQQQGSLFKQFVNFIQKLAERTTGVDLRDITDLRKLIRVQMPVLSPSEPVAYFIDLQMLEIETLLRLQSKQGIDAVPILADRAANNKALALRSAEQLARSLVQRK